MSLVNLDGLGADSSSTYRWALRSTLIPLLGGVAGAILFWAKLGDGAILDWLAFLAIATDLFCLWKLYQSVQEDQVLSEDKRRRYLRAIPLVGPVAALEIVLFLRTKSDR